VGGRPIYTGSYIQGKQMVVLARAESLRKS